VPHTASSLRRRVPQKNSFHCFSEARVSKPVPAGPFESLFMRLLASLFLLSSSACVVSASQKYARAPRIANPLDERVTEPVPGMANTREPLALTTFDGTHLCFEGNNSQDPGAATATRYSLRFLETDAIDFQHAPGSTASRVRILQSSSELVPVTRVVQDTVKDGRGAIIATVQRQVQEMERQYQTQLQVCFSDVKPALSPDARFMVLFNDDSLPRGAWGIPMGSRSAWVWRFPKADSAPPVQKK
jgi:hypothetical protein